VPKNNRVFGWLSSYCDNSSSGCFSTSSNSIVGLSHEKDVNYNIKIVVKLITAFTVELVIYKPTIKTILLLYKYYLNY
jgi:hypothetical protein